MQEEPKISGYKVAFKTARRWFAGTAAQVHFELVGDRGVSGLILPRMKGVSVRVGVLDAIHWHVRPLAFFSPSSFLYSTPCMSDPRLRPPLLFAPPSPLNPCFPTLLSAVQVWQRGRVRIPRTAVPRRAQAAAPGPQREGPILRVVPPGGRGDRTPGGRQPRKDVVVPHQQVGRQERQQPDLRAGRGERGPVSECDKLGQVDSTNVYHSCEGDTVPVISVLLRASRARQHGNGKRKAEYRLACDAGGRRSPTLGPPSGDRDVGRQGLHGRRDDATWRWEERAGGGENGEKRKGQWEREGEGGAERHGCPRNPEKGPEGCAAVTSYCAMK